MTVNERHNTRVMHDLSGRDINDSLDEEDIANSIPR